MSKYRIDARKSFDAELSFRVFLWFIAICMLGNRLVNAWQANSFVMQLSQIGTLLSPFRFERIGSAVGILGTADLADERITQMETVNLTAEPGQGVLPLAGLYLASGEPGRVELLLRQNNTFYARFLRAIACYWRSWAECNLRDAEIAVKLNSIGLHSWLTGNTVEGFYQLRLAERLDDTPTSNKAFTYMLLSAGANTFLHDVTEAIRWGRLRVQAQPHDKEAYLSLAALYLSSDQTSAAWDALQIAEQLGAQGEWRFFSLRGQVAWKRNAREDALRDYFQAYYLNSSEIMTAWYLGSALAAMGRREEACIYLNIVIRADRATSYHQYLIESAEKLLSQIRTCPK